MQAKLTENQIIKLYIEVDDLLILYRKFLINKGEKLRIFKTQLNASEICTILVSYQLSGMKNFEYFYREQILGKYNDLFPQSPKYETFLGYLNKTKECMLLWLYYKVCQSQKTGNYFIDSKKLEVCHIKREHSHRVFKQIAGKGKSSTGWFYGLKIHLVINELGEIVSFLFTSGNISDNNKNVLHYLLDNLEGKCVGDKGYISSLFEYFYEKGLHLITKARKNMKNKLLKIEHKFLLKKRALIESVFNILNTICDLEHSRHRNKDNAFCHMFASLIAYQNLDKKPSLFCGK